MLTYNREQYVFRAVESILSQTYRDFEFIIVDNGSTDRSGQIVDEYASKDSRIQVIHRPRGNIGAGRNTGLDVAKGEYIAFIDDDDWAEPDFLEFLYNLAVENRADISICGATDRTFDEKRVMSAEEALVELMRRKKYTTGFPMKLFRKKLSNDIRFSEKDNFDDIGLIYKLFAKARTIVYHGLPKYYVLRHEGNNSAWTTDYRLLTSDILDEYLNAYRARTEWLCEKFPDRITSWRYFECSFMISMVEKINRLRIFGCEKQRKLMINRLMESKNDFLNYPETLEFEKKWLEKYVTACL